MGTQSTWGHAGRGHEMVRDQVRRHPVEPGEEGEARRLRLQEEGKEVNVLSFAIYFLFLLSFSRPRPQDFNRAPTSPFSPYLPFSLSHASSTRLKLIYIIRF